MASLTPAPIGPFPLTKGPPQGPAQIDLRTACQELEGVFLGLLLRQMWASIPRSQLLPRGVGRDIFEGLWMTEVARGAARSAPLGLAGKLEAALRPYLSPSAGRSEGGGLGSVPSQASSSAGLRRPKT